MAGLDPADIRAYRRDGCVLTRNLLSTYMLGEITPVIREHTRRLDPNTKPLEDRETYDRAFTQVMNVWREDAAVAQFLHDSPLAKAAARLMGVSSVRLYHDQALFKEAGGGVTPWHCDQVYWPIANDNTVTAWFPLQDTPLEMGPLSFAKGSDVITEGRAHPINDESDAVLAPMMAGCDYLSQAFELGDVSWHSGWTYHNAGANRTERPREAFTVIFIDADTRMTTPTTLEEKADAQRWCPGVKPCELIASKLNPILWSAP